MTRALPIVVLVVLSLTGCREGAEKIAEAARNSELGQKALTEAKAQLDALEAEEAPGDEAALEGEAEAAQADPAAPEPVTLDEALVERVLAYQAELYEVQKAYLAELRKDAEAISDKAEAGEDEGLAALGQFARMAEKRGAQEEALEAEQAKLLAKHELSEPEVEAVNEIVTQVATLHLSDVAGSTAKMREALEQARAQASEGDPRLARFEAQVEQMEAALNFTDLREQYGDAPVDAVLARKDEVTQRYGEMLRTAFGK